MGPIKPSRSPTLLFLLLFPHLPSSVSSSKFRIPHPLCLPLLRKQPGCVPTIPKTKNSQSLPTGTLMNPETACSTSPSISVLPHCQQRTPSGRRCRLSISDQDSGLCSKHAALLHKDLDQADHASSLIGDIQEFRSAADINHSLGELYKLQARNKISPRRAAVMVYTASLLLRTLLVLAKENLPESEQQGCYPDFSDWPNVVRNVSPHGRP